MSYIVSNNHWVSDWMELLLKKIAANNIPPTKTSRWTFLASTVIYNSYAFITMDKSFLDQNFWTTSTKGLVYTNSNMPYIVSWIEYACQYFMPILIRTYIGLTLTDTEIDAVESTHIPLVDVDANSLTNLKSSIDLYLSARDGDGWKISGTFIGTLPNNGFVIYADNSVNQNLNTLPSTNSWTPLSINGATNAYLTPEWGNITGVVSYDNFTTMISNTQTLYPDENTYLSEMEDVYTITNNLTDEQKMLSEFWAGGPYTITPPGMFVYFTDIIVRSNDIDLINEIKYYAMICSGLFQASLCAWRLKRINLQARPVQKIRQLKFNQPISESWNSQTLGQYWLPYQKLNFVTPPFPDFVSGHSTFGSTFARIIDYIQKSDQIVLKKPVINNSITSLISPVLNEKTVLNFAVNNVFLFPKTSEVESNVPSAPVVFNWGTWTDVALSCGLSRIYGGIHVKSSNLAGNYLGIMIGDNIWSLMENI